MEHNDIIIKPKIFKCFRFLRNTENVYFNTLFLKVDRASPDKIMNMTTLYPLWFLIRKPIKYGIEKFTF